MALQVGKFSLLAWWQVVRTVPVTFDCNSGLLNWKLEWSDGKKEYCCQTTGQGCGATTTSCAVDCRAGISNWEMGWSSWKKEWCCKHENIGCPSTTPSSAPYDCNEGLANWLNLWSAGKKSWCCKNKGLGCTTTTTSCHVDCHVGLNNWELGWGDWKKEYCCKHENLGCPSSARAKPLPMRTTTTSCHVDCHVGLDTWEVGWGEWKKEWCCKHENLGCPSTSTITRTSTSTTPTSTSTTPTTVTSTTATRTSTSSSTETTLPYDCRYLGGFWSTTKTEWCCKHEQRGCTTTSRTSTQTTLTTTTQTTTATSATTLPYDCFADYTDCYHCLERRWTFEKRKWCCTHSDRGCPSTKTTTTTTSTTLPYNCSSRFSAVGILSWSLEKQTWCCRHENQGCTTTTTTPPYDCKIRPINQVEEWSAAKQTWCCKYATVGCTTTVTTGTTTTATSTATTTTTFNCHEVAVAVRGPGSSEGTAADPASSDRMQAWSVEKRDWCCQHTGRGCTTTTTSAPYDCATPLNAALDWSADKQDWCCTHEKRGCTTTMTTTTVRTTMKVPDSEVLTCNLNCFGQGAQPVKLPGSVGAGSGASLNGVSLQECRNVCAATEGCEAVLFTNQTRGVPWKSMCFGKADIHTSKCQPGGTYLTEVIGSRPWGKCAVFGDPHVITWDRIYGPPVTMTDPGEFHLIKSEQLTIHGRFGYTRRFPTASSTVGIALGGPMLKGHTLVVEYVGPEQGYKGFQVFWDGTEILAEYPSEYESADGILRASHDAMDPMKFHREGRHTIGGTSGLLPSYYFRLQPDLNVYVLLGPDNCNTVIETRKVPGSQDGYCGNFNCIKDDDSLEALRQRGMADTIPEGESLFRYGKKAPAWVMKKVATPSLEDCDPAVRAKATVACKGLPNGEAEACVFDACAANRTEVAREDIKVLALPFNCQEGQPATWEEKKRHWCCSREDVGCQEGSRAQTEHLTGCKAMCSYQGQSASCVDRIRWAAQHTYLGKDKPCLQAHKLVLSQCDACGNCSGSAAGCTGTAAPNDMVFFKRMFADEGPVSESTVRLPRNIGTLASGMGAGLFILAACLIVGRATVRRVVAAGHASAQDFNERVLLLEGEPLPNE